MSDNTGKSDRIWAYVNHQMEESERADMEKTMRRDPALATEVDAVRLLDRELHTFLPRAQRPAAELEDLILTAMDRDGLEAAPVASADRPRPGWWQRHSLQPNSFLWTSSLLAAAALLVAIVLPITMQGPVRWESAQFVPLQYRTADPAVKTSVYSRADATRCMKELRGRVRARCEQQAEQIPRPKPAISLTFVELDAGQFSITVAMSDRTGNVRKEWSEVYTDPGSFVAQADVLADEIVDSLLSGANKTVGKP